MEYDRALLSLSHSSQNAITNDIQGCMLLSSSLSGDDGISIVGKGQMPPIASRHQSTGSQLPRKHLAVSLDVAKSLRLMQYAVTGRIASQSLLTESSRF
jgi:hypothetical protein